MHEGSTGNEMRLPVNARDCLTNLQFALRQIRPIAESAQIPWRDREAYDDWDELATALFVVFVVRPWEQAVLGAGYLPLAPYDMKLQSFADSSVIATSNEDDLLVFSRLCAGEGEFALAACYRIDDSGVLLDHGNTEPISVPLVDREWQWLARTSPGQIDSIRFEAA